METKTDKKHYTVLKHLDCCVNHYNILNIKIKVRLLIK